MERVRKLLSSPLARRKSGTMPHRTFGVPLEVLVQHSNVPLVIVRLCQYIESRGMAQEGLFRVSGNARLVDKLRWSFDQTGDAPLEAEGDVVSAAALLKLLFRELPEPLVAPTLHRAFLDAIQVAAHDKEECTRRLKCLVEQLPPGNFAVLKYLCHFLHRVAQSQDRTRMTPSALGIVFGPNLFRFTDDLQGLKEQAVTNQVVTCFIANYTSIFEGDAELSCTSDCTASIEDVQDVHIHDTKCNGRMVGGMSSLPMEPLSVVIPPLDETMLTLKQPPFNGVPTLMIDRHSDDRRKAPTEGTTAGTSATGGSRSCKRKERKLSGEEWPPRSSSEERPAPGPLVEPQLASRRCSSHEEVASADGIPEHLLSTENSNGAQLEEANRDLSPHPPQPKRREIETIPTSSSNLESQDWHEACRSAERTNPHHYKDVQFKSSARKTSGGKAQERPQPHPREHGKVGEEEQDDSVPHTPNTPNTLSKDNIPPLDLDSFREEEPVLSEHRFSWPLVQTLHEEEHVTPYLQKANSYEAPLSPSAFRSYLSHRSLHLDPHLPPSPPVEQDDFVKSTIKEEEAASLTVKQLSKKIHVLKKKVKHFEEGFENERGYRPSHAEKMNHPEVKKLLLELNKLRKDLKNLKEENGLPEPAYLSYSTWGHDQKANAENDDDDDKPTLSLERALNDTLSTLCEKRKVAKRPDSVDDMSREQVLDEKLAIQKALLRFESVHGRPSRRADRNLMRPLYDRYRSIKRLAGRPPPMAKGKDSELQPILEHVAMDFTSPQPKSPPQELDVQNEDDLQNLEATTGGSIAPVATNQVSYKAEIVERASSVLEKYDDSNLHELPLKELLQQQQQSRLEKRRLRKLLREFEEDFQKQTGRKVQKEDKAPMDAVYCEYKHVKARVRLLEALVSKHEQRQEV
uniref:Putative gtpase-activator protein n=2 Tax=Ornithodoros turicata TaxID=34597 RepID=A0A2R5L530_9ACAR